MKYLSPLASAEIEQLEQDGIAVSPEDVVRINALAWRVQTPEQRLELARGKPVPIGGASLWPLTLYASDWFSRIGSQLGSEQMQIMGLAYAMANGREDMPEDIPSARKAVTQFRAGLRCTYDELIEAVQLIHDQWDHLDTGEQGRNVSPGELSVALTALSGVEPQVWEYQCSIQYVVAMLDRLTQQASADGKSGASDPKIKAERALGLFVWRLKKKHEKETNRNG